MRTERKTLSKDFLLRSRGEEGKSPKSINCLETGGGSQRSLTHEAEAPSNAQFMADHRIKNAIKIMKDNIPPPDSAGFSSILNKAALHWNFASQPEVRMRQSALYATLTKNPSLSPSLDVKVSEEVTSSAMGKCTYWPTQISPSSVEAWLLTTQCLKEWKLRLSKDLSNFTRGKLKKILNFTDIFDVKSSCRDVFQRYKFSLTCRQRKSAFDFKESS